MARLTAGDREHNRKLEELERLVRLRYGTRFDNLLRDRKQGKPIDIGLAAEVDTLRIASGLPPKYGNPGTTGRLKPEEGGPVPAAVTPKIYGGGGGSNRDPPVSGGATTQRVRETAEAERRQRQDLVSPND